MDCSKKNIKAFESFEMKSAITYKWQMYARDIHTFQLILYSVGFISFVLGQLLLISVNESAEIQARLAMVISCFISIFFLLFEIFQFYTAKRQKKSKGYLTSGWNLLQVTSYLCMCVSSILFFIDSNVNDSSSSSPRIGTFLSIFGGWSNIIMSLNIISFLRPYTWSGPLIRMLIQIFQDMLAFIIIQVILLFGFTIAFMVMLPENMSFQGPFAFMTGYTMLLGDFNLDDFQMEDNAYKTNSALFAFSIYMLFVPVVTMNLLIAIMGDSYDYVRENQSLYGLMEKAKAINEIDNTFGDIFFSHTKKEIYFPKFFHVLTKKDDTEDDNFDDDQQWEGHLNKIQRKIDKSETKINEKQDKLRKEINEKQDILRKKSMKIMKN